MASRARSHKYPKELETPGYLFDPESVSQMGLIQNTPDKILEFARELNRKEFDRRLQLLADHYQAVDGQQIDWRKLANALAVTHVPGLTLQKDRPRRRGRLRRDDYELARLYQDVLDLYDQGKTIANACKILARPPSRWQKMNAASLETRFHEAKRWAEGFEKYPQYRGITIGVPALTKPGSCTTPH